MKLAEALSIRADLQKKVAQLKERIKESAKVQEGAMSLAITGRSCTRNWMTYSSSWKTWFIASTSPTFR